MRGQDGRWLELQLASSVQQCALPNLLSTIPHALGSLCRGDRLDPGHWKPAHLITTAEQKVLSDSVFGLL